MFQSLGVFQSRLVIVLLGFSVIINGQKKLKEDLRDYDLYGNVKQLTEFSYGVAFKKKRMIKSGFVDLSFFAGNKKIGFNVQGDKIKEITYNQNREILEDASYVYDVKGRKKEINYLKDFKTQFKYNRYNKISKEIWCKKSECFPKFSYTYLSGRLVEKRDKGENSVYETMVYTYEGKHKRPNKETALLPGRKVDWVQKYKYGEKGEVLEKIKYNTDENIEEEHTYQYDEKGRVSEKISHHRVFSPRYYGTKYLYDVKNNVIKEVHYQLDANKNLLSGEGFLRTFEYVLDAEGNWIKCTIIQNTRPKYIIERVIEYY